ncbi:MAG: hypothetical protein IPP48_15085 [Chitinophagaceae bacterium]|nr:hypothetical protein [Chitinophagaceae bacterium]
MFYQTATRTSTATANIPSVIFITSGNGYTISNNIIGGSNTSGGGTPWTFNGAFSNRFVGINVASAVGAATTIQNNTITNLSISTTSGASTGNGIFCGISANGAGTFNIGNVTGNTIGATSGVGSITTTASTTAALTVGINVTCTGSTTLSNNSIGSITANGSAVTVSASITGIQITAGTPIVTNNVIGSTTTANSINSATVSTTGTN